MDAKESSSRPSAWGQLKELAGSLSKRAEAAQIEATAKLEQRFALCQDFWTGVALTPEDAEANAACQKGKQEKPPITEAKLTILGLQDAKRKGKPYYAELCRDLDGYLEGGVQERIRYERLAGTA